MPNRTMANPLAQQIGARVRDLRLEQGKSLAAMETASGISKGHLSSIERGVVLMNVVTMQKIAMALGVEMAEILAGGKQREGDGVACKP